jgi:hypothetical protein
METKFDQLNRCVPENPLNKNIKIFINWFLGPILLVWLGFHLYQQFSAQDDREAAFARIRDSFTGPASWMIYLSVLLMPLNWGIEAYKWKLLMEPVQKLSFLQAFKAVLAGTTMAVHTPNRIGEYFGRMIYMDEGNRLRSIALTVTGSFSQLIITLVMGSIGLLFFLIFIKDTSLLHVQVFWIRIFLFIMVFISLVCLLLYFKLSWLLRWLDKAPPLARYRFFFDKLEELDARTLIKILALSGLRYLVFVAQYLLVMKAFGIELGVWMLICLVSVLFLVLSVIPSIVLAEAGIRGAASVEIFYLFTSNVTAVVTSGWFIWLVNLMLPALLGGLLLLGKRIFKRETKYDK